MTERKYTESEIRRAVTRANRGMSDVVLALCSD